MADEAALRLKVDATGAMTGAATFDHAMGRVQQSARRAMMVITAMTVANVKAFAGYEEQLANVSTMLDQQTMRYLPGYSRAMKEMAIASGEGTSTLSMGLYNILSASIDADKAVSTLDATVRAAKAGMTDTGTAGYAITGILNAYGLAADKAGRISDILFATVKRGQTTFGQLAPVIGRVTAISAGAGISLEEVSAALSTITRGGISTEEAITGLRQAIIQLQGQQEGAINLAKQHGIELSAEELAAEGLSGMLEKISTLSEGTRGDIFKEVRARVALNVLLKDQAGFLKDYETALEQTGQTQDAYGKMTDTLGQRFRRLWQVITVGAIESGEAMSDEIKKITDSLLENESAWRRYSRAYGEGLAEILSGFQGISDIIDVINAKYRLPQGKQNYGSWAPPSTEQIREQNRGLYEGPPEGRLEISPRSAQRLAEMRSALREQQEFDDAMYRLTHRNFPQEESEDRQRAAAGPSELEKQQEEADNEIAFQRTEITARMYENMGKLGTGYYESQKELLELQLADYDKFIEDKVLLDEYHASMLSRLAIESSGFWVETRSALQGTQNALSDFMMDFGSLEGLIQSVGNSFQRMFANLASQLLMSGIMKLLVGGPMAGAMGFQNPLAGGGDVQMGGLFGQLFRSGVSASAMGNVFSNGRIVPMADGAVLTQPTYFGLGNGNFGLAGEAGPELGFVPLRRKGGRLGLDSPAPQPVTVQPTPVKVIVVANQREATLEAMRSEEGQAITVGTVSEYSGF